VLLFEAEQEFGGLEVSAGHPHTVLLARPVEVAHAPVDDLDVGLVPVADQNVGRLDVAVDDVQSVHFSQGFK